MKKYLIIPGLVGLPCGCTAIMRSPSVRVTPPSAREAKWLFSAKDDSGLLSDTITLYVNGTRVAAGTANPFQHSVHLTGSYEQHAILGDCNVVGAPRKSLASAGNYQCTVYIDGSKVTRLTF
ncbi:MAG: hypothetical protein ACYDB9_11365 [Gammaproteobacteria bacterium]